MNAATESCLPAKKPRFIARVVIRWWQRLLFAGPEFCYWTAGSVIVCDRIHRLCYLCNTLKSFFYRYDAGRFFGLDVADLPRMGGAFHEVSSHQAFSCCRWSQDERQPRGCVLERTQGDRRRARRYLVRAGWHD